MRQSKYSAHSQAFGLIVRRINDEPYDVASVPGSRAVTIKFIIPNSRMGSVIGKAGSKIKEIQEASGSRLNASEAMLPGSTEVSVLSMLVDSELTRSECCLYQVSRTQSILRCTTSVPSSLNTRSATREWCRARTDSRVLRAELVEDDRDTEHLDRVDPAGLVDRLEEERDWDRRLDRARRRSRSSSPTLWSALVSRGVTAIPSRGIADCSHRKGWIEDQRDSSGFRLSDPSDRPRNAGQPRPGCQPGRAARDDHGRARSDQPRCPAVVCPTGAGEEQDADGRTITG